MDLGLLVSGPLNGPCSIGFLTTEWSRFYWFKDYVNIVQSICMYSIVLRSTPIIEFALIFSEICWSNASLLSIKSPRYLSRI